MNKPTTPEIIAASFRSFAEYGELHRSLSLRKPLYVSGITDTANVPFLATLASDLAEDAKTGKSPIIVVKDDSAAKTLVSAISELGARAEFYCPRDYNFNNITASREFEHERLRVLSALAAGEVFAVVTTPQAISQPTLDADSLRAGELYLEPGMELPEDVAAQILESGGYTRTTNVEGVGQYAVRGGILDVCAPAGAYRIEFFGDEIDRLGTFDVLTQRMTENVTDFAVVSPVREITCGRDTFDSLTALIKKQLGTVAAGTPAYTILRAELESIEREDVPFIDKYIPRVLESYATLFDYAGGRVVLADPTRLRERAEASESLVMQGVTAMLEAEELSGAAMKGTPYVLPWHEVETAAEKHGCVIVDSFGTRGAFSRGTEFGFATRHITSFGGDFVRLREEITDYRARHIKCLVLAASSEESAELIRNLNDEGLPATADSEAFLESVPAKAPVLVATGSGDGGFELVFARLAVLDYSAAAQRRQLVRRKRREKVKAGNREAIMTFTDLTPGDFVVHAVYGIGRFEGIKTLNAAGVIRDYVHVKYQGTDELFLPVEQLDLLSKYIGAGSDEGTVKLSKMGGTDWARAKSKAKSAAREMARELIDLYARRRRTPGISFDPDDDMSAQFADAFVYEETDGQLAAVEDITRDMEASYPMDRLLCGDVGYGKTEVALRAAFKAVRSGYQVAVLVPTTILAYQHYQTIVSRMRGFPVNVDMLSRFRTPAEQAAAVRRLKRGETDIIVGTHRLISKDIEFNNLGLLIIDEEQRFGVAQKEKIKQMAPGVDVLTLSATPIPRTLNMAMGNLLDMSLLEEAPGMRSPVQTYVMEYDRAMIAEALRRELRRGGQAFYLHNRVESIYSIAARLEEDLPEARIAVGHGKMDKDELEEIWEALVRGEIDILVSTTIIETGVDVPNANTLIIDDADRYGLSQLHQLRGRVGRSARRAYAYFTYTEGKELTEIAEKRLEAIREYAEFGAGFRIAMRDMELRGAGNMLGAEQHGHMEAVGYDMYIKLLEEAVIEETGVTREKKPECAADVDVDAYLPQTYIEAAHHRMEMYKKIARIQTDDDLSDVTDELCDRFGELPPAAENLCRIAVMRAIAADCGIASIRARDKAVIITPEAIDPSVWLEVGKEYPRGSMRVVPGRVPVVQYRVQKGEGLLDAAEGLVRCYARIRVQNAECRVQS